MDKSKRVAGRGRYTTCRISTVAIDGSLKRAPGNYAAIGYGIVQLCIGHGGEPKYGEQYQECGDARKAQKDAK